MTVRAGTVYLVGAGPGDPSLITVRGRELLERADVVLYDRLAGDALLSLARSGATLVDVGKRSAGDSATQTRINAWLVLYARQGNVVVRLKGGDPLIFGRGWEERAACIEAGVPCELVPGISSALAGPLSGDIPVTLRDVASSVTIMAAPNVSDTQLAALSQSDTCVFLMGVRELPTLCQRLIDVGKDPRIPAAIVERATLPGQRVIRAPLHALAAAARAADIQSPAIVVVGETAAPAIAGSRHEALGGLQVLVTRPLNAAHELSSALRQRGADVRVEPLIDIKILRPSADVRAQLSNADWLVFTSRHGVRGFRRAIEARGDVRLLGHCKIAAVGPTTVAELLAWGLTPDLVPSRARVEDLAEALGGLSQRPQQVLFPCGTLARDQLPRALSTVDIPVDVLPVYETRQLRFADATQHAVHAGSVDAIFLASPSAAHALVASVTTPNDTPLICLGEMTALVMRRAGWRSVIVADDHSDRGMVDAFVSWMIQRESLPFAVPSTRHIQEHRHGRIERGAAHDASGGSR